MGFLFFCEDALFPLENQRFFLSEKVEIKVNQSMALHRAFDPAKFKALYPQYTQYLEYEPRMESTSLRVRAEVEAGRACSGYLAVTDYQSAGKGRRENAWQALAGSSLLFTLVIETELPTAQYSKLGLSAALAVVRVLRKNHYPAALKWPNDVWLERKKCCGILAETIGEYVLLGVGLNVTNSPDGGSCLSQYSDEFIPKEKLLGELIYEIMCQASRVGHPSFIKECQSLHGLTGKKVHLISGRESLQGVVSSISVDGGLCLRTDLGVRELMQAHSIQIME